MCKHQHTREGVKEVGHDQAAEVLVVGHANAIVEPLAVVVELLAAAVAGAAVLSPLLDVGLANDAVVVDWLPRVEPHRLEGLLENFLLTLLLHEHVRWH